jgi:hypothetical protein
LLVKALERYVTVFGGDGFRVDGLGLLRSFERDAQHEGLAILDQLRDRNPDLDIIVELFPLRSSGPAAERFWQEDGGVTEAIDWVLEALARNPDQLHDAFHRFRWSASPPAGELPGRRVVYWSSHDHGPTIPTSDHVRWNAALIQSAAAGLLALSTGRYQLAPGHECGTGAATPVEPYLMAVNPNDPGCSDAGLRSFVDYLLRVEATSGSAAAPVARQLDAPGLVAEALDRTLVLNLGTDVVTLHTPVCLGRVLAAFGPRPADGGCLSRIDPETVILAERG